MRKGVALGVLAVVEVHQKSNPAVGFFAHLEWQHAVRHKAVENEQLPGLLGDAVPVCLGADLDTVFFVKVVHFVGRIPLLPNMQIHAMLIFRLGSSFN